MRLDTLHEDLEQGAIDQLDNKLNDLLALIREKEVRVFGDFINLSRVNLLFLQII